MELDFFSPNYMHLESALAGHVPIFKTAMGIKLFSPAVATSKALQRYQPHLKSYLGDYSAT